MFDQLAIDLYKSISEANEPRVFEHWHASSIAECPRSHFYKRLGIKPTNIPTAAKMLRWQAGHLIEEVIRPHLLGLYPDLISNRRFTSKKLDLTGEFDNYSEIEKTIIEVKSVHNNAPYYLEKSGAYLNHQYQNHSYVLLLEENNLPAENIIYIYITLDGRILTFRYPVNLEILANVQKRLGVLKKALEGELPACLCKETHPLWKSTMQYCDYRDGDVCCSESLYKKYEENYNDTGENNPSPENSNLATTI